ncbi:uncharacterized protein LOC127254861 [Andrographis paniculata]|uniref:uncharacterized protein LOC127254861 n=1 Tax=Andrographis paniculata TaxID=175694 RepID=UPI0021E789BE|nr:uncharacterized protein LOC127254861 [Andrographis paniculata]
MAASIPFQQIHHLLQYSDYNNYSYYKNNIPTFTFSDDHPWMPNYDTTAMFDTMSYDLSSAGWPNVEPLLSEAMTTTTMMKKMPTTSEFDDLQNVSDQYYYNYHYHCDDDHKFNYLGTIPTPPHNWGIEVEEKVQVGKKDEEVRIGKYSGQERKNKILRYLNKRSHRNFNKTIKYACRKTLADKRVRIRGRFAKNNELPSPSSSSSSYCQFEDDQIQMHFITSNIIHNSYNHNTIDNNNNNVLNPFFYDHVNNNNNNNNEMMMYGDEEWFASTMPYFA